jgi:hypothetical protein
MGAARGAILVAELLAHQGLFSGSVKKTSGFGGSAAKPEARRAASDVHGRVPAFPEMARPISRAARKARRRRPH